MALEYFCCYYSYQEKLSMLTDEQVGRVFRAAMLYAETGTTPNLEPLEALAFGFIKFDIDQSREKYEERCAKNRENIRKRYDKPTTEYDGIQSNTTDTTEYDEYQYKNKNKDKNKEDIESMAPSAPDTLSPSEDEEKRGNMKKPQRHKYGQYNNVLLTDEEYGKLQAEFPDDYEHRIERLSGYMESTGKVYKSHFATIRNWASQDSAEGKSARPKDRGGGGNAKPLEMSSFDTDEFYKAAVKRSYVNVDMPGA